MAPLSKLHIIWLVPLGYFGAQFIALSNVPVISPFILRATRAFLAVVLVGVRAPIGQPAGRDQNSPKIEFIKILLRQRLEKSGVFDEWRNEFIEMTETMVMGTPEATLVTIVETYAELRGTHGWTDEAIFNAIERHRNTFKPGHQLPTPLTLGWYISYRLTLEHGHGDLPLTDAFVADGVRRSLAFFGK